MKTRFRLFLLFGTDLLLLGVFLLVFALFHHVLPRKVGNLYGAVPESSRETLDPNRFSDKFAATGKIEEAKTADGAEYRDDSLYLSVRHVAEDGVRYTVAEFYLRDITRFRTAFAGGDFYLGRADSTLNLAHENDALIAINGDYCGIRERSVVIRNGQIYRKTKAHQVCVLYHNGVMETYSYAAFDVERAIAGGAWQAWDFGPALLDAEGKAVTEFATGIAGENPRSVIGYYEPGHYLFLTVDGRQSSSRGMTLPELAALCEALGLRAAYNLDGGHSAVMVYDNNVISSPSKKGGRDISDILYIPKKSKEAL